MLPTTPRRPASAGPTGRNVISPQSLNRQLPQLPPLGAPIQLDKHIESNNSPATGPEAKRAVLLDVVLERDEDGGVSEAAENIIKQLGTPLNASAYAHNATASTSTHHRQGSNSGDQSGRQTGKTPTKPVKVDKARLASLVHELQDTEKRYLKRIACLKNSYADPLRKFARRSETMIIPVYDAKVMFANIDTVVEAAERFCHDLQEVDLTGRARDRNIGDVCLHHLKGLKTLDCYRTYYDKQDESQRSFRSMLKRPSFETFTDSVKYQTSGIGNIGVRELLAEPVQRIPRYTLLWQGMVDSMSPHDSQRQKLEECIEIASKIAMCETDERTKRATVMYCLERTVDGFPANLISNNRDFIDCIDADDILYDRPQGRPSLHLSASNPSFSNLSLSPSGRPLSPGGHSSSNGNLNCTLFLFDDKLVIAKRQHPAVNGRKATGLDDLNKMMRGGGGLLGLAQSGAHLTKDKLSFKGIVDLFDITAVGLDGGDFQLAFRAPPTDQVDKWAGRPVRNYTVVHPPLPPNTDTSAASLDRQKFIRNLWTAQALMRAKPIASAPKGSMQSQGIGLPTAYMAVQNHVVESRSRNREHIALYTNLWARNAWESSHIKTKTVVQINSMAPSADLSAGDNSDPSTIVRLDGHQANRCNISIAYTRNGRLDKDQEDCSLGDAIDRAIQLVHAIGDLLPAPVQGSSSQPTTPTSARSRPALMTLDTLSRSLFGNQSISSRSKSTVSRSSTLDTSRFSIDTKSTAATSFDSDHGVKTMGEYSPGRSTAGSRSGSQELDRSSGLFALNEIGGDSEADLNARLDLAKINSISTTQMMQVMSADDVSEMEGIARTAVSRTSPPRGALHVRNRTPSPPPDDSDELMTIKPINLPVSATRPLNLARGRTPSPTKGPRPLPSPRPLGMDLELASSTTLTATASTPLVSPGRLLGPRQPTIKRERSIAPAGTARVVSGAGRKVSTGRPTMPLKDSPIETDVSPTSPLIHKRNRSDEVLAPRKRSFDRHTIPKSFGSEMGDEADAAPRALPNPPQAVSDSGIFPPQMMLVEPTPLEPEMDVFWDPSSSEADHSSKAATTARQLKVELERLDSAVGKEIATKQRQKLVVEGSPGLIRSPPSRKLSTHVSVDADRSASLSSRRNAANNTSKTELDASFIHRWVTNASALLEQVTENLSRAECDKVQLREEAETYHQQAISSSLEVNSLQGRLARATSKADLAKSQIRDLTAELETVYETFNVELDSLFTDMQLPPTEAFKALTRDVQETKAKRNDLHLENIRLRRELQESNMKREELSRLLRAYGNT